MKVSFIIVYSQTFDKEYRSEDFTKKIKIVTNKLISQIESIPIEKEIILMDNDGDFTPFDDFKNLKIIKSIGSYLDSYENLKYFIDDNIEWLSNIKDINLNDNSVKWFFSTMNEAVMTAIAFQHGIHQVNGDYIILQHNDTEYLFNYYSENEIIHDVINYLEDNNLEYITIDKKRIKNTDYTEFTDKIEYYADCYWFLCRSDFYSKHGIWVDWIRGDNNHLATVHCVNNGLKFEHLPGYYEMSTDEYKQEYTEYLNTMFDKYPDLKMKVRLDDNRKNLHSFDGVPFLLHYKGGTTLRKISKMKF